MNERPNIITNSKQHPRALIMAAITSIIANLSSLSLNASGVLSHPILTNVNRMWKIIRGHDVLSAYRYSLTSYINELNMTYKKDKWVKYGYGCCFTLKFYTVFRCVEKPKILMVGHLSLCGWKQLFTNFLSQNEGVHKQQILLSNAGIPHDLINWFYWYQLVNWFVSGNADCPGGVLGLAYSAKMTHPSRNCNTTHSNEHWVNYFIMAKKKLSGIAPTNQRPNM